MQPLDKSRFLYSLVRSIDNQEDINFNSWNDASGNTGFRTLTFTTGNKDNYYLVWGIHGEGAFSLDDIKVGKVISLKSESFEEGSFGKTDFLAINGTITSDSTKVVSGNYSANLRSSKTEQWKEFAYTNSNKVKFEPNTAYIISFSYKAIDMQQNDSDSCYYFLARSTDNLEDKDRTDWKDSSGNKGRKTVRFTTGSKENYYLIWGIHNGGELSLDDIEITKVSESFENGSFFNTNFKAGSGMITTDPTFVVSGKYSAYLRSQTNEKWKEFSYSDLEEVRFEPYTTYSITFIYKSLEMDPVGDNYFYFLARSSDNQDNKGWTAWKKSSGTKEKRTITFTTGSKENYYLIWGIHKGEQFQ
ncbi:MULTISPECIES: hypothetical protein [unclassified Paenibacillus]|uniref:hypothetical protein n=1 Tax=unclassified Paenibacillus TaxID=185978 RepID=UPI0030CDBC55